MISASEDCTVMQIFRRIILTLHGRPTVSFPSDFDLEESVRRLQKAVVRKSVLDTLLWGDMDNYTKECVIGKVTETKVTIRWAKPLWRNFFAPCLAGCFEQEQITGKIVLKGTFSMIMGTKICLTAWLLFYVFSAVNTLANQPVHLWHNKIPLLIYFLLSFCFGLGLACFGSWVARNEEGLISDFIRRTLLNK